MANNKYQKTECSSSMDTANDLKGWEKLDLQKVYDLLGKLLSEDLDYKVTFTLTKKIEE